MQRQSGARSDLECAVRGRFDDVRDRRILDRRWHRVDEDELVANVAPHQVSNRDAKLTATIRGIRGDGAVRRQDGAVECGVRARGDLDDHIDAVRHDAEDLLGGARRAVVDNVLGPRRTRELGLLVSAYRRDHLRSCPARELDRGVADRSRPAGDHHRLGRERPRLEATRPGLRRGQADVRRQRRDAETRPDIEGHAVCQRDRLTLGQGHVLLCRSVDPLPGCLPQPHPLPDARRVDALTDGIHGAGAVLVWHPGRVDCLARGVAATSLPVGRIHARHRNPNANLTGPRLRH